MLGYQDVASYRDLFTPDEWDSLTGNPTQSSQGVTIEYPPGQFEGNENRYELDCDSCGHIGAVDTLECAEAVARLHEEFVGRLITDCEVPA